MNSQEEKEKLARAVWLGDGAGILNDNPELTTVLQVLSHNIHDRSDAEYRDEKEKSWIESVLASLARSQSQKVITLLTARYSLAARRMQMPRDMWQILSAVAPGLFASKTWTQDFAQLASNLRPPCPYQELGGVGAVMFDNYTRKVLYKSNHTTDSFGFRLDMTNSGSMVVPHSLAPPRFDAAALFLTPFGPALSMQKFCSLFLQSNAELKSRKSTRFSKFLYRAADGKLFVRPSTKPNWVAHMNYHEPMPYVLQSSYEDVEVELNVLRGRHLNKRFLFVGGDGLSINRVNHLINMHPNLYQDSAPFIIPVQGEAPHGVYHVMHAGWRLYWRFIRACKEELRNDQVIARALAHVQSEQ